MEYEKKERALSALCPHCLKTFFFFIFFLITLRSPHTHNTNNNNKKKKTSLSSFSSFFLRWFFFLLSSVERFYEQGRVVAAVRLVGNSYGFAPRLAYNQNTHTHTHAHFVIVVKEGKTRPQGCHLPTTSQQERGRLFVEVSVRYTSPHTSVYTHVYRRAEAAGRHKLNPVRHAATHPREEPST